ncbi:uncharacterized protein (DUF1499 family) [Salinibacter ruber]|uniref:DUF1499 domain-containing protein n=1 Tax=Salinibacter ruber TaxID=146919 RepID=UPI002169A091|nr:uncharacterized protein (DUF1499 family) [Salinibacter ruber]MCS3825072.1 uncharacterized protein (DUF1499 family) [Salinibacter ruber]MCS4143119.1 uncharacterized protein (DUF1499 family) [Salinibacter ruber]
MPPFRLGAVLLALTLPIVAEAQSLPDNPLSDCPDTPNCERVARGYEASPDTLYAAAERALESLGPVTLRRPDSSAARRLEAVYRVALLFKDDVAVAVRARDGGGSALYVRSASRVGHSDLGVNRRRVDRFLEAVGVALRDASSTS